MQLEMIDPAHAAPNIQNIETRSDLDRIEFVEIAKNQFAILPATGSVRELRGLLRDRPKKPVSIEDMNRAIAKGALRSR